MSAESIYKTFENIINWAVERGKVDSEYGIETRLYLAEIHAIAMIGDKPGVFQQELCEALGVTKGRISILISNLVKKGLVEKRRKEDDKKQIPLYLTEKGEKAYEFHKQKDEKLFSEISALLEELTKEEIEKFDKILKEVAKILR